ncbi:MAG: hypothetical protein NXI04_25590 [Planctomycetaceae bacterium]|nr:hypothetical protein [Planctomycetaceae bacterium]
MKRILTATTVLAAMLAVFASAQAEEKATKVEKVKCAVAGKEIKIADAKVATYKGAKVYVCCGACKAKLEKTPAKFAVKANHQLVLTGQAKQVNCPFAGKPADKAKSVEMAGVKVAFCCGGCQGKAKAAKGDKQLELVFSDKAFAKGFKVTAKK